MEPTDLALFMVLTVAFMGCWWRLDGYGGAVSIEFPKNADEEVDGGDAKVREVSGRELGECPFENIQKCAAQPVRV